MDKATLQRLAARLHPTRKDLIARVTDEPCKQCSSPLVRISKQESDKSWSEVEMRCLDCGNADPS